jgi:predicted esterase
LLSAAPLQAQPAKAPLLVLLEGDSKSWQAWCAAQGWHFLAPWDGLAERNIDLRIKALETRLAEAKRKLPVEETRVYLAGQGDGAAAVFYVASRVPDLWAAAVALGGSARPAIDSNRLFAANTTNLPVLWLSAGVEDQELAGRLKAGGYNLEWRRERTVNPVVFFQWLAARTRDPFPARADCETGTPAFPRCYWVEVTRFDPAARNDVLESTRIQPMSGASLAAGPFGYDAAAPGPGVLVAWLPEDYQGPLQLNDRIVAVGGKEIPDARAYIRLMDQSFEEGEIVIMVQRGRDRIRLETRTIPAPRPETVTARLKAEHLPESGEVQVLSRGIAGMRLTIPSAWVPASLSWNGTTLARAESGGCWLLSEQKQLLQARKCP